MRAELAEVVDFLAQHAPFDALGESRRTELARQLQVRYFRRGSVLLELGQPNNSFYILRSGAADIVGAQGELVERSEPGGSFGAASLLAQTPSRFRITAIEDCLVLVLPGESFRAFHAEEPAFEEFYARSAAARLRRATSQQQPDTSVLRVPVSSLIGRPPVTATPETSIRDCARLMTSERVSALLITDGDQLRGILTDRDLRSRVVVEDRDTSQPVSAVMTADPFTIGPDARAFDVFLEMTRLRVHHLPVVSDGAPVGMVSAGDLMRLETSNPVFVVGDVWRAADVAGIVAVTQRVPGLVDQLIDRGAAAQDVTHVLTAVADAVTARLIALAEAELGPAPSRWCWLALGSQGRREHSLGSDQDHAIIVADETTDEQLEWYHQVAVRVRDGLEATGQPLCPGDVMATNPRWCTRLAAWRQQFHAWVNQPDSTGLLHSQIFFDARAVHGDASLLAALQTSVLSATQNSPRFLGHLAAAAVARRPPLGFFRNFVLADHGEHKDTFDIKTGGLHAIIELVRVHALAAGIPQVGTLERLRALPATGRMSEDSASELADAFEFIGALRLRHQAERRREGQPADNFVSPDALTAAERRHLKEAFQVVRSAQQTLSHTYQTHLMS